jgi:transcription termination factor NusB
MNEPRQCPYRVTASRPDDEATTEVMNGILEHQWRTNPDVRDKWRKAMEEAAREIVDREIMGTGFMEIIFEEPDPCENS